MVVGRGLAPILLESEKIEGIDFVFHLDPCAGWQHWQPMQGRRAHDLGLQVSMFLDCFRVCSMQGIHLFYFVFGMHACMVKACEGRPCTQGR
jgi:hypothetical protein